MALPSCTIRLSEIPLSCPPVPSTLAPAAARALVKRTPQRIAPMGTPIPFAFAWNARTRLASARLTAGSTEPENEKATEVSLGGSFPGLYLRS